MAAKRDHQDYTVAVVSALWFETGALLAMLQETHPRLPQQPGDDNSYRLGTLEGHNVVLVCLPGTMGNTVASHVTTNLMRTFPAVKTVLLVGIGGGVVGIDEDAILERDLRLGDVVVGYPSNKTGNGVVEYDLGRETVQGYERKGFLQPAPALLRSIVTDMRLDVELRSQVGRHVQNMKDPDEQYERPDAGTDVLFHPGLDDPDKRLERPPRKHPNRPKIHYGIVATGNTVVKTLEMQRRIVKMLAREGEALCFEMEAAGVATAVPCLVIRGICDYADSHKNKKWQFYAAATAAAYAKEVLRHLDPVDVKAQRGSSTQDANGRSARDANVARDSTPRTTTIHQGQGYVIQGGSHTFGDITFNN